MNVRCDADSQAFDARLNIDDGDVFDQLEIDQTDCTIDVTSSVTLTNPESSDDAATNENQSLVYFLDDAGSEEDKRFSVDDKRTDLDENAMVQNMDDDDETNNIPVTIILCQNEEENTLEAHLVIQQPEIAIQETSANIAVSDDGRSHSEDGNGERLDIVNEDLFIASNADIVEVPSEETDRLQDSNGERYVCKVAGCTRSFKWAANLHYHMLKHSGTRPHKCPHENCDKTFLTQQRLQVHILSHTGEKPFPCPHEGCCKSFSTAGNLKNHSRTHTGEKPFVCDVPKCGKSFAELSSLKKHANTHTGVKQFSCSECGRYFAQASSRNVHLNRHRTKGKNRGAERTASPTAVTDGGKNGSKTSAGDVIETS